MITEAKDLMNSKDNALATRAIKKIITQKRRSQQHIQEGELVKHFREQFYEEGKDLNRSSS